MDCLFCKIAAGAIPSKKVREDDAVLAFYDIEPKAPTHILVIPKKHIASLADAKPEDEALLGRLLLTIADIAREQGLADGYRVVISTGAEGGQTVDHLHVHLLGGRKMHWPPG
ncbi:MAG TPA: histidine triad nucleotide-binding protein [Acidobacteriaceae bacterium]|jgi:histidine triad (HIT) family protein|nr:histidine triad nucleotide-binding protein [Acidobacteriaceae bacterium]